MGGLSSADSMVNRDVEEMPSIICNALTLRKLIPMYLN